MVTVPPLTRRCARPGCDGGARCGGSSAHAEMRLARTRRPSTACGFLRSRGDAPLGRHRLRGRCPVPPLTRRCAPSSSSSSPTISGSSAHAEMRRCRRLGGSPTRGFLRSRGDAPAQEAPRWDLPPVPPLTRRCARESAPREGGGPGSSAHAEMRRRRRRPPDAVPRFLRSRGDAPGSSRPGPQRPQVPPLTRRCALTPEWELALEDGSSAHAEMRRAEVTLTSPVLGFLRSRGDAPSRSARSIDSRVVPPLTRRCAARRRARRASSSGSSAHAEMRRARPPRPRSFGGFLRSRGDAPRHPQRKRALAGVPPLTRRCAPRTDSICRDAGGSSAHAEMRRLRPRDACIYSTTGVLQW